MNDHLRRVQPDVIMRQEASERRRARRRRRSVVKDSMTEGDADLILKKAHSPATTHHTNPVNTPKHLPARFISISIR